MPPCEAQQQRSGHRKLRHRNPEAGKQHAEDQASPSQTFARPAHHRIENPITPDQLDVMAGSGHQFAHVMHAIGLPVFDAQVPGKPDLVPCRRKAAP